MISVVSGKGIFWRGMVLELVDLKTPIDHGATAKLKLETSVYGAIILVKKLGDFYWVSAQFTWIGYEGPLKPNLMSTTEWTDVLIKCMLPWETPIWTLCDDKLDLPTQYLQIFE